jgi:exopolyphosphatase/guanosine-5'-triphosphate,3'-diphosphate pyrophosphatase
MNRIAAVDIGTNTILMLIAEGSPPRRVVDRARIVRLGRGVDHSGMLDPATIGRALDCLREYKREAGETQFAVIGTQALREAKNASEFVEPAETILGAKIEIISGEREALLAWRAVHESFPELSDAIVMDVGGGSTEFVVARGGAVESKVSVPIGSVRLFEHGGHLDPGKLPELPHGLPMVGTAGTVTTLAAIHGVIDPYDPDRVHGMRISRAHVAALLGKLWAMPIEDRKRLPGLDPARADVIVAGATIVLAAMKHADAHELIVSDRGIRWGLASERLSVLASRAP